MLLCCCICYYFLSTSQTTNNLSKLKYYYQNIEITSHSFWVLSLLAWAKKYLYLVAEKIEYKIYINFVYNI